MIETFVHQFSNGTIIKVEFDLSKDMPSCQSNLMLDMQTDEVISEYRMWRDEVVLPLIIDKCTDIQLINFGKYGKRIMEEKN